jgi:hypothetical protein
MSEENIVEPVEEVVAPDAIESVVEPLAESVIEEQPAQ